MKRNTATKAMIWIILILLSVALVLPFITPLFQKLSGPSLEQMPNIDISDIQFSTPEPARKAQEDAIAAIEASSAETQREGNTNEEITENTPENPEPEIMKSNEELPEESMDEEMMENNSENPEPEMMEEM